MIIVDYGDLLRPIHNQREKRNELESIYEEMRAIAQDFDCPLWTASQTNRSVLNAEVITMESISEAFSKCFVADFIFSVSRTVEDKAANSGRVYVAKNRNGPDGLIYPISTIAITKLTNLFGHWLSVFRYLCVFLIVLQVKYEWIRRASGEFWLVLVLSDRFVWV